MMQFSAKTTDYQHNLMLNICDADILERHLVDGDLHMHMSKGCYGERLVGWKEAEDLLEKSLIINMVGEKIVRLAIEIGVGSEAGIRTISGIPFLIVFK